MAVIGAGPVGLAAAARLARRREPFVLLEAGPGPGTAIREWGHVRLFSPWELCVDPVAGKMLAGEGWEPPDPNALPTGRHLVEGYLEPLAQLPAVRGSLRYGHRVTGVSRAGRTSSGPGAHWNAAFASWWRQAGSRWSPASGPGRSGRNTTGSGSGTVPPHGAGELAHPEPDFYVVGMKSYGRAPTFLLPTGYEQVRSVVAALTGDDEEARRVELQLPETGVCSADAALEAELERPGGAPAAGSPAGGAAVADACHV